MDLPSDICSSPLSLNIKQSSRPWNDIFQLNRQSWGAFVVITSSDSQRTLTFACNAEIHHTSETVPSTTYYYHSLDLLGALRSRILELVDDETQEVVRFPPSDESIVGRVTIPSQQISGLSQKSFGLSVDTTAAIWKDKLQQSKTYRLRVSASGGEAWCYYGEDTYASPARDTQRLPVRREPGTAHFTVYNDPLPPTCSVTFRMDPPNGPWSLSGTPPVKCITEITLDHSVAVPVTINMYHEPFNSGTFWDLLSQSDVEQNSGYLTCPNELLACFEQGPRPLTYEQSRPVDFGAAHGCWDEDPHPKFPGDGFFVELWPGGPPFRHEYIMERWNDDIGGLEMLEAGKRYDIRLSDSVMRGLSVWQYGTKDRLLKGSIEEKLKRWEWHPRGFPPVKIKMLNGPITFEVVD